MNFFTQLFGKASKEKNGCELVAPVVHTDTWKVENPKYKDFSVEYYPRTGRYFAVHKSGYLHQCYFTGIVRGEHSLSYGTSCYTQRGAWKLVDLYLEQERKVGVQIFRR